MNKVINDLSNQINNWNCESVVELRDYIRKLKIEAAKAEMKIEDFIDVTNLKSNQIIKQLDTSYPIWAVDNSGMCLTGDDMEKFEYVKDILIEI